MEKKVWSVLLILVLSLTFWDRSLAGNWWQNKKPSTSSSGKNGGGSSLVFRVEGNVYPDGLYYVTFNIGNPPKSYYLDLDTGSDLTWLQCDAPCQHCDKVPHPLYKPNMRDLVLCKEQICASLDSKNCNNPNEQCDYNTVYADRGSSLGVLIKDVFPLRLTNGSIHTPRLAFGCGYDQQGVCTGSVCPTDGVLGLGNGGGSILSQLKSQGLTKNVIGHCLSGQSGGYLFFGDDVVPSSGVVWTPMSLNTLDKHYSPGPAELSYGGKRTGVSGLRTIFDSGSSYTYFNSMAYQALISAVKKDLVGKPLREAADDSTLPLCWRRAKQFKSVGEAKTYFSSVVLSFGGGRKTQFEITPESYLIISTDGNVCLGILNGTEVGLDTINLIGDTSMRNKMVIYDNEKQQIGWIPADCNRHPKVDLDADEGFFQPYPAT
ncbi:aspartic proteinase Asp1-like isoform X2 [Macadamia integrifolia]|uniref:aspartic proteinase Asp1-like isoform X2 n=1 Tax=Macadamia integrifolia TaxID=60698 RepID=UPI001C4F4172|nr:aspartic proteinase Asp1-like isoform X2 [Macadamia integrifolia]